MPAPATTAALPAWNARNWRIFAEKDPTAIFKSIQFGMSGRLQGGRRKSQPAAAEHGAQPVAQTPPGGAAARLNRAASPPMKWAYATR
jgi:hypothetical protein